MVEDDVVMAWNTMHTPSSTLPPPPPPPVLPPLTVTADPFPASDAQSSPRASSSARTDPTPSPSRTGMFSRLVKRVFGKGESEDDAPPPPPSRPSPPPPMMPPPLVYQSRPTNDRSSMVEPELFFRQPTRADVGEEEEREGMVEEVHGEGGPVGINTMMLMDMMSKMSKEEKDERRRIRVSRR